VEVSVVRSALSVTSPARTPSERARHAVRTRWGPQRVVRLDQLDPDTARLIRALLAQREAQSAKAEADGG
jgi:hypothetical protein